MAHC